MLPSPIRLFVCRKFAHVIRNGLSAGLLVFATAVLTAGAGQAQLVDDWNSYPMPSIPRPGYLVPFTDPVFGTTITRITDAGKSIANPTGNSTLNGRSWGSQTGHAYSSRAAWNADQSLMMMEKGTDGMIFLDGSSYTPLFRRSWPGDVRWHPIDPDVLLYIDGSGHCVGAYEPRTNNTPWERCFSGYRSMEWSDPGKGKPSLDGKIIPVRAQRSSDGHWVAFLYYIDSDTRTSDIDMTPYVDPGDDPQFVMSPLGDTIIINGCIIGHTGKCEAQMALDVATRRELWRTNYYHDPGHADEAVDANGEAWRIGVSKEGPFKGHIIKRNFRTGEAVTLIPYWGEHTSTRGIEASRNMAIVSYAYPSGSPLRSEIAGVCLDGSCFERYAHTHNSGSSDYLAENHGSISQFGNKIVFRSDWDVNGGPIDDYVIEFSPNTPLVAAAGGPYTGTAGIAVGFDGSGSTDSEGTIISYDWDFGDGGTGIGAKPNHSYAGAGTFSVTLTVADDNGATNTDSTSATISAVPNSSPVAKVNGPYTGTAGTAVTFSGSGSTDSDGLIVAYAWKFGDGFSGSGVSPTHSYSVAGTYTVTLTVTDDDGATNSASTAATISAAPNAAPVANAGGPYSGTPGAAVAFSGSRSTDSDGTIVAYAWNFGDGRTGSGINPSHAYSATGTYTVTLTVTDDDGATNSASTNATISAVPNAAPVANAGGPYAGTAGAAMALSGSRSTDSDGTNSATAARAAGSTRFTPMAQPAPTR